MFMWQAKRVQSSVAAATATAAGALKLPRVVSLKNLIIFEIKAINKKSRKMSEQKAGSHGVTKLKPK